MATTYTLDYKMTVPSGLSYLKPEATDIKVTFSVNAKNLNPLYLQELSDEVIKLCEQYKGFVSARQFQVKGSNEHFILMQWENEHAYLACRQSPAWLMLMPQWSALQEDGDATLDIKILTE